MEQTISKRIWHIIQAVYYMIRKGISKKKLMMDLHLLLQRGKLAGKSLSHLLTPNPHTSGNTSGASAFSCLSVDPKLYNPTEVEFSCSNTPYTPATFHLPKWGKKSHKAHNELRELDAVAIAKAFEILNTANKAGGDADMSALATPSPMLALALGKSPAVARQLRVTDSPFAVQEGTPANSIVDQQADAFIKRFYEQLRLQQSVAATPTPDHSVRRGRRGLIQ
ncbi:Avr9/Cf-9 rapidly elicited protein [Rhynchospora pubera]|uniref:Avr9/Cf-9 rapidly elicited protein n=1 Tax=Rhynchospora pubera TaxID=906938 RepID=A0AAV8C817_9POAL|nr:Avr9/Cf-9 rapidly elicited protein [Rhynchospora pubera]